MVLTTRARRGRERVEREGKRKYCVLDTDVVTDLIQYYPAERTFIHFPSDTRDLLAASLLAIS